MGVRTPRAGGRAGVGDAGATASLQPVCAAEHCSDGHGHGHGDGSCSGAPAAPARPALLGPCLSPPRSHPRSPPSNCSTSSATSFIVSGEPRTVRGARRVATLRAAGSELAAPSPVEEEDGPNLPCGTCNSNGWLVCDFCKGQKTNVQVRANKFYRRCPSCRAVGVVICPQCKVFKCVTFPDGVDGY